MTRHGNSSGPASSSGSDEATGFQSEVDRFWSEADRLREELRNRPHTDSTEIVRRGRDGAHRDLDPR